MGQDQGKESVSLMCVDLCCVNSDVIDGLLEKETNQAQTLLLRAAAGVFGLMAKCGILVCTESI